MIGLPSAGKLTGKALSTLSTAIVAREKMESKYSSVYTYQNAGNGRVLLGFISSVLAFLFFFVSFVIPKWNNFETEEYFGRGEIRIGTIGLWQNCKMYDDFDCVGNTGMIINIHVYVDRLSRGFMFCK